MEKQLVLFDGEKIPASRAKALMKIESTKGKEAAVQRNLVYNFYGVMKEKITAKTGAPPGMAIIARQKAINKAVGVESINQCPPEKYGTVMVCCNIVVDAYDIENPEDRRDFIKAGLSLIEQAGLKVQELLNGFKQKPKQEKAAA